MTRRMKSAEVRAQWRDVLDLVRSGEEIVIEHYNKTIARIVPEKAETVNSQERQALADQIATTLADHASDHDIDAIIEEIGETYGYEIRNVDEIPSEEYWPIVMKHEKN